MQDLKPRKTNIVTIIEEGLAEIPDHDKVDFVLKSFIDDEEVWVDHERMVNVFHDLGQNAVEAMPRGGLLTISVTENAGCLDITLADNGSGIAEAYMPLLFTPFFTTKPLGEGSGGLGLPLAFAAVKAHKGLISVASNADPDQGPTGTTVKITLPKQAILGDQQVNIIIHEE